MTLSESGFHDLVDQTLQKVEDVFDNCPLDVDLENNGGTLDITFENKSHLIFSRQPALTQLWIAARSGGFHCDYHPESQSWVCATTQESLKQLLARVTQEQSGTLLDFSAL